MNNELTNMWTVTIYTASHCRTTHYGSGINNNLKHKTIVDSRSGRIPALTQKNCVYAFYTTKFFD